MKNTSSQQTWKTGKMASLAVPSFESWYQCSRVPSPLLQWRGNINYHFVRVNMYAIPHKGRRREKHAASEGHHKWGSACPLLANYILTKHFKGSYKNQSKPGCQCPTQISVLTDVIWLRFHQLTSSDHLLNLSSFFEVASTAVVLLVSVGFSKTL